MYNTKLYLPSSLWAAAICIFGFDIDWYWRLYSCGLFNLHRLQESSFLFVRIFRSIALVLRFCSYLSFYCTRSSSKFLQPDLCVFLRFSILRTLRAVKSRRFLEGALIFKVDRNREKYLLQNDKKDTLVLWNVFMYCNTFYLIWKFISSGLPSPWHIKRSVLMYIVRIWHWSTIFIILIAMLVLYFEIFLTNMSTVCLSIIFCALLLRHNEMLPSFFGDTSNNYICIYLYILCQYQGKEMVYKIMYMLSLTIFSRLTSYLPNTKSFINGRHHGTFWFQRDLHCCTSCFVAELGTFGILNFFNNKK